jgi:hypothetical protein
LVLHLARITSINKHKEQLELPHFRLVSVVMTVQSCICEVNPLAIEAISAEPHVKAFI